MPRIQEVLSAAFAEETRGMDDQNPVLPLRGLRTSEDDHGMSEPRSCEDVRGQSDDRLDEPLLQESPPDPPFGVLPEEGSLRKYRRQATGSLGNQGDHVLDPGVLAGHVRRETTGGAAPRIGLPDFASLRLEREGKTGDHAVEGGETAGAGVGERRATERVLPNNLEVLADVEHEVRAIHLAGAPTIESLEPCQS